jgi:hypothetical protein
MKTMGNITRNMKLYSFIILLFLMNLQTAFGQFDSLLLSQELSNFRGEAKGMHIELSWIVSNQYTDEDFAIERAGADGIFNTIGTTTENFFKDHNPCENVHYYRLSMLDARGKPLFSKMIAVEFELKKEMIIAPNPATNFIEISFYIEGQAAQIAILNQQGNLVHKEKIETPLGGMQRLHVNVEDYAAGVYLLQVADGIRAKTMQFVVL